MDVGKVWAFLRPFHTHKAQMPRSPCPFASLWARDGICGEEEKSGTAGLGFHLGPLTLYLWLQLYSGLYLLDMRGYSRLKTSQTY